MKTMKTTKTIGVCGMLLVLLATGCARDSPCVRQCQEANACDGALPAERTCEEVCEESAELEATTDCEAEAAAFRACVDDEIDDICVPNEDRCVEELVALGVCTYAYCNDRPFSPECNGGVETCPVESDIGSSVGEVQAGTTCGAGDDHTSSCGDMGGEDLTFRWTAPETGSYQIDTFGSAFDTTLDIGVSCPLRSVVCSDDEVGAQGGAVVEVEAGDSMLITVDGWGSGDCGDYVLNITRVN